MQKLADLVIFASTFRAHPLLELRLTVLKLREGRKRDGNQRVKRLLNQRVELLASREEYAKRRRQDRAVYVAPGRDESRSEDGPKERVLRLLKTIRAISISP